MLTINSFLPPNPDPDVTLTFTPNSICFKDENDNQVSKFPQNTLVYKTSLPAKPDNPNPSGNTTDTPEEIPIYGIGVYVTDLSSLSLKDSTFYADLRVYVLKYYKTYTAETKDDVLRNALDPSNPSSCQFKDGEKWLFLNNVTISDTSTLLTGVNLVGFPQITPVLQPPTCDNNPHLCTPTSHDPTGTLDHIRLQSNFAFQPQLSDYPFATQTLPILLEFPFSTTSKTDYSFCSLDRYTGFSPYLSSQTQTSTSPSSSFTMTADITAGRYPPFSPSHTALTHSTPRYNLEISFPTPLTFSALTLLPSFIILLTCLLIYVLLPLQNYFQKTQALATSLLAAVLQQSSISQATRGTVVSLADWFSLVVYAGVTTCLIGSGIDGWMLRHHEFPSNSSRYSQIYEQAKLLHTYYRIIPLMTPFLFLGLTFSSKKHGFIVMSVLLPMNNSNFRIETPGLLGMFGSRSKFSRRKSAEPLLRRHMSSYVDTTQWKSWTNEEVLTWLSGIDGLKQGVSETFQKEEIDGSCLRPLTASDLKAFGLSFKESQTVMTAINNLKGNTASTTPGITTPTTPLPPSQNQLDNPHLTPKDLYNKAEKIMSERFGGTKERPIHRTPKNPASPKPSQTPPPKQEVEMKSMRPSFTEMRANMFAEPPPRPAHMPPEIAPDVKGALLSEGIFPTDIDSMPPEIRDILSRRPELLKEALDRSKANQNEAGDIFSDDLITIDEEPGFPTSNTTSPPQLSTVQQNMVKNNRGYAERFAGAAAAAELNGIKVASSGRGGQRRRVQYEDDEDYEDEGDGVGLLGSGRL
ncbi:hypothetical protein TL16_g08042 [Triparma laevis f. inornata]|uniref:SAM domain-containing protein n=1 Tax=Triparma laevis f. inornata TaxID=1714386 RepID=A0A9W7B229_9STRA|nr:hypothetical protein TL16_g08042 [Triparma laevis f. inornata]